MLLSAQPGSIGGEPHVFPMVAEYMGMKRPRSWPYMSAVQATTWCPFNPSKAFDSTMAPVVEPTVQTCVNTGKETATAKQ